MGRTLFCVLENLEDILYTAFARISMSYPYNRLNKLGVKPHQIDSQNRVQISMRLDAELRDTLDHFVPRQRRTAFLTGLIRREIEQMKAELSQVGV